MKRLLLILMALLALFVVGCSSEPAKPSIDYRVVKEETISTDRYKARILVDKQVTNKQLEEIANYYVYNLSHDKYVKECYVFFTDNKLWGNPQVTLGKVKWSNKDDKFTENNLSADSKDWTKRPTEEEYKIFDELPRYITKTGLDEDTATAEYAKTIGKNAEYVDAAFDKVTNWILM